MIQGEEAFRAEVRWCRGTGQEELKVGHLLPPLKTLPGQHTALAAALSASMHLSEGPAGTAWGILSTKSL